MELFLHNKISEEQTLWWNLYSVTTTVYLCVRGTSLSSSVSYSLQCICVLREPAYTLVSPTHYSVFVC